MGSLQVASLAPVLRQVSQATSRMDSPDWYYFCLLYPVRDGLLQSAAFHYGTHDNAVTHLRGMDLVSYTVTMVTMVTQLPWLHSYHGCTVTCRRFISFRVTLFSNSYLTLP